MITLELTKGQRTIIDDIDSDLSGYSWSAQFQKDYAGGGKYLAVCSKVHPVSRYLHRVILTRMVGRALERREMTDHVDLDTLNNLRGNLRIATHSQNITNSRLRSNNTSGFKGVCFNSHAGKWQSAIMKGGVHRYLGLFESALDAALAYNRAALELHGEFAMLYEVED